MVALSSKCCNDPCSRYIDKSLVALSRMNPRHRCSDTPVALRFRSVGAGFIAFKGAFCRTPCLGLSGTRFFWFSRRRSTRSSRTPFLGYTSGFDTAKRFSGCRKLPMLYPSLPSKRAPWQRKGLYKGGGVTFYSGVFGVSCFRGYRTRSR